MRAASNVRRVLLEGQLSRPRRQHFLKADIVEVVVRRLVLNPVEGLMLVVMVAELDPGLRSVMPSLVSVLQQVLLLVDRHQAHQTLI